MVVCGSEVAVAGKSVGKSSYVGGCGCGCGGCSIGSGSGSGGGGACGSQQLEVSKVESG